MAGPDPAALLARYCPTFILHSQEVFMPSSVEWYLARANYVVDGQVVLAPVGTVDAFLAQRATWQRPDASSVCFLPLRGEGDRNGEGLTAPVYGAIRRLYATQGGVTRVVGYDLSYWLYFPFNGNIADLDRLRDILAGIVAGSALWAVFEPFTGGISVGVASAALDYLRRIDGILMHEGDWEHATVRVDTDGNIRAVCCSAHGDERWYRQEANVDSALGSRDGYKQVDDRPLVFVARSSHGLYAYPGTTERLGGFANDETEDSGVVLDALQGSSRLVSFGFVDEPSPPELGWIGYRGRWGKAGDTPGPPIHILGEQAEDLVEYTSGPTGPQGWWATGDDDAPDIWPSDPPALLQNVQRTTAAGVGALTSAKVEGHALVLYTADDNDVVTAMYDGEIYWHEIDPSLPATLVDDCALAFAPFGDSVSALIRSGTQLRRGEQDYLVGNRAPTSPWRYGVDGLPPGTSELAACGGLAIAPFDLFDPSGSIVTPMLAAVVKSRVPQATWAQLHLWWNAGKGWTEQVGTGLEQLTADPDGPVALASYGGRFYLAYTWQGRLSLTRMAVPTWTQPRWEPPTLTGFAVANAMQMALFDGQLYLIYQGGDGGLYWTRYDDTSGWLTVPGSDGRLLHPSIPLGGVPCGGKVAVAPFPPGQVLIVTFADPAGRLYSTRLAL